jgi:hypothetical protein
MRKLTNDSLRRLIKEEFSKMNEARGGGSRASGAGPGGPSYDVGAYGDNPFDRNNVLRLLKTVEMELNALSKDIDIAASGGLVDTGFFPNEFSERLENGFDEVQASLSALKRDLKRLHRAAEADLK